MARLQTSRARNGPSQLKSNVEIRHRFRFISSNGAATPVTATNLIGACGCIGTITNTQVVSIARSVKLNQIEIWAPPASQGSSATCSVEWLGSNNSPNREFSDTSVSVSTPAYVKCSPPPQSLGSFWQQPASTVLATIVAPSGSIIDVHLSFILNDDEAGATAFSVATDSVGGMYFLALDGYGSNLYTPVSLTTTH